MNDWKHKCTLYFLFYFILLYFRYGYEKMKKLIALPPNFIAHVKGKWCTNKKLNSIISGMP